MTLREITPDEIAAFDRDGVIVLRNMFGQPWIDLLTAGLERHRKSPTPRGAHLGP